ncbi:hypothetical protein [Cupriavidus laharis]|uniref:hypothetical protein n=1 Tax=Cupriavidus laharis TaxID=151654 RepID=UPI001CC6C288|nr:hypothetical protein [Cupriavidus laharis]
MLPDTVIDDRCNPECTEQAAQPSFGSTRMSIGAPSAAEILQHINGSVSLALLDLAEIGFAELCRASHLVAIARRQAAHVDF